MQINKVINMWLIDSVTEIDLKIQKAANRAKQAVTSYTGRDLRNKVDINASGQQSIKADLIAEDAFFNTLINEGLTGVLYSEESGIKPFGPDPTNPDEALILLLDPLDGSQNFIKGLPIGCISVAYSSYRDEPKLLDLNNAIITNLYNEDSFFAKKGNGAYFNSNKLDLEGSNNNHYPFQISYYAYGTKGSVFYMNEGEQYNFRSLGSSAWELAIVADQQNDAYIDLRGVLKAHDFAAAKIIIEEANGYFKFLSFDKFHNVESIRLSEFKSGFSVLATNDDDLMDKLLKDFEKYGFI